MTFDPASAPPETPGFGGINQPETFVVIWWRGTRLGGWDAPLRVITTNAHGIWLDVRFDADPFQFFPFSETRIVLVSQPKERRTA